MENVDKYGEEQEVQEQEELVDVLYDQAILLSKEIKCRIKEPSAAGGIVTLVEAQKMTIDMLRSM